MNDIELKIKESLKWKKSAVFCANKIGISLSEYKKKLIKIKSEESILKITKNESDNLNLTVDTNKNPKSPLEIIQLLNINTNEWKLSNYWSKELENGKWRISAHVVKIKHNEADNFEYLIKNWKPKKFIISDINTENLKHNKKEVCGVMSLQDIHFGKEGNETVDLDFENSVKVLIEKGIANHYIETLYFVVGGDLINMDTFNGTTTSGTPVDNSIPAYEAYIKAFDSMVWAINYIKHYCKNLVIVYIPGNHDRLSSFHLVHALSKAIKSDSIIWDIKYAERKVHVWGKNFNAFEHGDVNSKNTPLIYATEFHKEWGQTKNRTLFTGHYHTTKKTEYITNNETVGFIHKILPSLSKTDYYHYHNKYVGNKRSAKLELQDPEYGNISEFTYYL
jgi:hypothetical protein